jgi:hypothetical protein
MRFDEPHKQASCGPHATKEKSVAPPRGAVSSSVLRGDSETECLLEKVVDDSLDDDDPFFLVKRLVAFFHGCSTLPHKYISGVFNW